MSDDEKKTEDENTNNDKTCANLGPLLNMRWLSNVLISSKTCSGKSHMLLSLLYHAAKKGLLNKTKTQIVVFSGSADTCDDFKSILPKAYIRRGFCEQTCLKVLALHKKKVELRKKQAERSGVPVLQDHLIVILDDCIPSDRFWLNERSRKRTRVRSRYKRRRYIRGRCTWPWAAGCTHLFPTAAFVRAVELPYIPAFVQLNERSFS